MKMNLTIGDLAVENIKRAIYYHEGYDYNVKRIIRLLKAWNAKVGYPFESYSLEREIANMRFSGDNIESGFFYAIDQLSTSGKSNSNSKKIEALQNNAEKVEDALDNEDISSAMRRLGHILPL